MIRKIVFVSLLAIFSMSSAAEEEMPYHFKRWNTIVGEGNDS